SDRTVPIVFLYAILFFGVGCLIPYWRINDGDFNLLSGYYGRSDGLFDGWETILAIHSAASVLLACIATAIDRLFFRWIQGTSVRGWQTVRLSTLLLAVLIVTVATGLTGRITSKAYHTFQTVPANELFGQPDEKPK